MASTNCHTGIGDPLDGEGLLHQLLEAKRFQHGRHRQ